MRGMTQSASAGPPHRRRLVDAARHEADHCIEAAAIDSRDALARLDTFQPPELDRAPL